MCGDTVNVRSDAVLFVVVIVSVFVLVSFVVAVDI